MKSSAAVHPADQALTGREKFWLAMMVLIFVAPKKGWTAMRPGSVALSVSPLESAEKFHGALLDFPLVAGSAPEERAGAGGASRLVWRAPTPAREVATAEIIPG